MKQFAKSLERNTLCDYPPFIKHRSWSISNRMNKLTNEKKGRIIVLNWYTCFTFFRGRPGNNIKKGIFQLFEHEQKTNKNAGQKNTEMMRKSGETKIIEIENSNSFDAIEKDVWYYRGRLLLCGIFILLFIHYNMCVCVNVENNDRGKGIEGRSIMVIKEHNLSLDWKILLFFKPTFPLLFVWKSYVRKLSNK